MKTLTVTKWSLSLAMAVLPLAGGCVRESVGAPPPIVIAENSPPSADASAPANDTQPPAETQDLENAPAKIVSTPSEVAPAASLSASAAEIARMSQSGVDENVMLTYVNNASSQFALGSDQIIYLNDIGVPGNVVTAMIQRDQALKASGAPVVAAPEQQPEASQPPPTTAQDPPPPESNVTYTYFRDSLAPYGNWVEVEGYGQCWQPSVVVVDRGWTPYCDRGHWVYSDCGWYWASDYSWGWAPFHYGRWFRHNRIGWCWAPDTVWGPSWVSWRYNSGYCGWAPLPPSACFRPGFGFTHNGISVGVNFPFPGLRRDRYTFVTANHFTDPHPFRYRVPHQQVNQFFNNTVIINPVTENRGNTRFHRGIPPKEITKVTHTEIKQVKIHETTTVSTQGRAEDHDRNRGTLTVFRPTLPTPSVSQKPVMRIGEGVKAATPATVIPRIDSGAAIQHRSVPNGTPDTTKSESPAHRNNTVPVFKAPGANNNNPPRNIHDAQRNPSPAATMESPGKSGLHQAAPVINTPRDNVIKTPPPQNNLLQQHQPTLTPLPKPVAPTPRAIMPSQPNPSMRDTMQRSQPRQEKPFIPTMPTRITPQAPASQPRIMAPTPARSIPQVTAPRPAAPAVQAPRDSGQRPSSNGNSRDKQDGSPRRR